MARGTSANDTLLSLANETDGIAIVNTNDLSGGMKRIADDLAAYYVLGYYTTNTKFDGGIRSIKVQLKSNGKAVRARRQYRAPTQAEITALAAGVGASSSAAPLPRPRRSPRRARPRWSCSSGRTARSPPTPPWRGSR